MHANELIIPPIAAADANGIELLRAWAAQGKQHVSIATGIWRDAAAWGIMLVDLANHIASAYNQTTGQDFDTILARIRHAMDAEWGKETDKPTGKIQY